MTKHAPLTRFRYLIGTHAWPLAARGLHVPLSVIGVAAAILLTLCSPSVAAAQMWDANRDFSCARNPNGSWSYGYTNNTLSAPFSLFGFSGTHGGCCVGCGWALTPNAEENPGIIAIANSGIGQATYVTHGNSLSQYSVLRWTSPQTGCYDISARLRGYWRSSQIQGQNAGGSGVLVIGGVFVSVGSFGESGAAEANLVLSRVSLLAGDTVDLISNVGARPRVDLWISPAAGSGVNLFRQPSAVATCPTGTATFSVSPLGTGPVTYQWRKNGNPIDTIANPSAATANLTLTNVGPADVASYDCIVTNTCGSVTSNPATLTLATKCSLADIVGTNGGPIICGDSTVDGSDFVAFINSFAIGDVSIDPLADVAGAGTDGLSPDGTIDGSDFVAFINAFALGC